MFFYFKKKIAVLSCALLVVPCLSLGDETLIIVSSFPSSTTTTFKNAFETKYPKIKIEVIKKSTSNAAKHIKNIDDKNKGDIFWASSPDIFEDLKEGGFLLKYDEKIEDIPSKIGASFVNDPEGFYKGFALSGYGIMENKHYTSALQLPVAMEWDDLKKTIYHDHIGMCSPSRSGTTHLTVEILLQAEGWQAGWYSWKEIAANLKTITNRSFDVPSKVNTGEFGLGIVIDFFGLSFKAMGFPIAFSYPKRTPLVPASIAIVKKAENVGAAKLFIKFVLSDSGQKILLDPRISRLPINPRSYSGTSRDFPNPFTNKEFGAQMVFNAGLSKDRYNVVNALFDTMITYNLKALKKAMTAIRKAEEAVNKTKNKEALKLLDQARQLIAHVPVEENKASNQMFNDIFTTRRKNKKTKITGEQAVIEKTWDKQIKENYKKAAELAEKARWM